MEESTLDTSSQKQTEETEIVKNYLCYLRCLMFSPSSLDAVLTARSGNHAALEHFVRDGSGHAIEKLVAHLRILAQHFDRLLF